MKKSLIFFAIFLMLLNGAACAADVTDPLNKPSPLTIEQAMQLLHDSKPVYSCGMKPNWFSGKPGQCPCCTMSLMKVKAINGGKAVFEEGNSMNMDMKNMPMKDNGMEKK
ncbi:MAG: hypothetical protein KGI29_00375 [Pseudomonadota bacterium]|nr:hypothetical protein [Pseudomonadota bacterium]MDE3038579.1 hypothetical protein [Pseudomonadota bacterium]